MSKKKKKKNFFVDASKLIDIDKFNEYKNSQNKIIDEQDTRIVIFNL